MVSHFFTSSLLNKALNRVSRGRHRDRDGNRNGDTGQTQTGGVSE